jgi:hypothetical protein
MKTHKALSCALIISVSISLFSCDLINFTTKTGFITILLNKGAGVKTLVPIVDMEVDTFNVVFAREGLQTIELKNLSGSTNITSPVELLAGIWTVEVKAFNLGGDIIGTGSTNAVIQAGKSTSSNLTVNIIAGNGTLNLTASWPTIELVSPSLSGTLNPITGDSIPITFIAGGTPGTYEFSSFAIPSGSYTLELLLKDGTEFVSRVVDTVGILNDATTSGSITFVKDPNFWGRVNATISIDLPTAVTFTFDPVSGTKIIAGVNTNITVTPSRPMDSYSWYVNGIVQPSFISNTFDTGTELPVWVHVITVVGKSGTSLFSASTNLEIIPNQPE